MTDLIAWHHAIGSHRLRHGAPMNPRTFSTPCGAGLQWRQGPTMADDSEQGGFDKFEAEARAYAAAKNRERMSETRGGNTRSARREFDTPNPAKAHERHQTENSADQEKRLSGITDPARRNEIRAQVAEHYRAWGRALGKAYNQRYDISDRLYAHKLADRKIDERLIPRADKEEMRREAIREAVVRSDNRIQEINGTLPRMINKTIDDAAKLPSSRKTTLDKTQQATNLAEDYQSRNPAQRGRTDRDFER